MSIINQQISIYDLGFNRHLSRALSVFEMGENDLPMPSIMGSNFLEIAPSQMGSGELVGNITMVAGLLQSYNFETGVAGWQILYDGDVEFNSGVFRGSLVAGSIHIPDQDTTANSFHTDSDGNSWWGCTETDFTADNDNANAYILKTGVAKFQSATVLGLVVGTNVGLGIAQDSAGVTTIIGDTVITGYVNALAITVLGDVTAGTLTGVTIQTAASGERLRMQGSPANEYQFLDDDTKVGHLKIDDDGSGGYYAELYIDYLGAGIIVGSTIGAAEHTYFSAPFFSGNGRAAVGEVKLIGSTASAGLEWAGGGIPNWSFDLGTNLAKISSNIVPSSTYNLGTSVNKWQNLYLSGNIVVDGTVDGVNIASHRTRHYYGGADPVITNTAINASSLGISSNWAYDHDADASAHHTKYTDANARSAVTGTTLPGNLVLGDYDVSGVDNLYVDDIYGNNVTEIDVFESFDMNSNNVNGIDTLSFDVNTGSPGSAGQMQYFDSGGVQNFRLKAGTYVGTIDLSDIV